MCLVGRISLALSPRCLSLYVSSLCRYAENGNGEHTYILAVAFAFAFVVVVVVGVHIYTLANGQRPQKTMKRKLSLVILIGHSVG